MQYPISIHSLRMEGDCKVDQYTQTEEFQSTPSAWRETSFLLRFKPFTLISIHSLRMEGDFIFSARRCTRQEFQSTPSAWRETKTNVQGCLDCSYFNPLPPHGGRRCLLCSGESIVYFNPLPPHGGRPDDAAPLSINITFQSTPSAWRETIFNQP